MTQLRGSGLSQPASEEGWQCVLSLCLVFFSYIHLSLSGAPKMSCFPEHKCHWVKRGNYCDIEHHTQISLHVCGLKKKEKLLVHLAPQGQILPKL